MTKRADQQLLKLKVPVEPSLPRNERLATARAASKADISKMAELMAPAVPSEVFVTYWAFAYERQQVFLRRINRLPPPWTNDEIIAVHRFTNPYRATDRVSQYLIRNVQYDRNWSPEDLFLRTMLFKFFNRIETWERIVSACGEPQVKGFSASRIGRLLDDAMRDNVRIYSAAYIMPSGGPGSRFRRKHNMHLHLLERMLEDLLAEKLASSRSMGDAFSLLRAYPSLGDFLAYQYVTDLNYSKLTSFEESEFVVAGPGSREGIAKCFHETAGKGADWIIRRVTEVQDEAFRHLGLPFAGLWGRKLQLIDCQNLFCEVAKYSRVRHPEFNAETGRTRIKQKFVANSSAIEYLFPPKWGITVPALNPLTNVAHI